MNDPNVTVVLASHNTAAVIGECLSAIKGQANGESVEIIVADSSSDHTAELVKSGFPGVRLLHFSEPLTVPQLRGAGIAEARGEIIAIIDPYCIVDDHWLARLRKAHAERPELVIGGVVELEGAGGQGLVRWATFLSEYDAFVPPVAAGPTAELTGNNLAYKRAAFGDLEGLARTGFWKTFFNRDLRHNGHQLWTDPLLVVRLRKPIPFLEFLGSRYHHGRCFGALRVANAPRLQSRLRAVTTPLLPALGLSRQIRRFWPKGRYRAKFAMVVPLLFLFHVSWAWGELWGYLRGPGRSSGQLFY